MIKWTLISFVIAATLIGAASNFLPNSERTHCWDATETER